MAHAVDNCGSRLCVHVKCSASGAVHALRRESRDEVTGTMLSALWTLHVPHSTISITDS